MTLFAVNIRRWRHLVAFSSLALTLTAAPAMASDGPSPTSFVPSPPGLAATSWVLMDAKSGRVLVEHDADERVPPASLTKMMTAYIAESEIESGNMSPDDEVRISKEAWQTGGSRMFVKVNSNVPVKDLMQGIVVQSGNDATVAMAEHIAGSQSSFADLMNAHARQMGLQNTHFMNPTGLPDPEHYSSAHDMAIIARHIINDFPDHYSLYAEKYFTWNGIKQPNRNLLLWRDKSVDGLKTGHTEEAGYCLVASAQQSDTRLIAAVMGTNSEEARSQETQKLLSYGFRYFETQKVYDAGQELTKARVWGGTQDEGSFGVAKDVYLTASKQNEAGLSNRININGDLQAPIEAGQQYGTVQIVQNDEVIDEQPLVALESIEQGGLFKRLWDGLLKFVQGLF